MNAADAYAYIADHDFGPWVAAVVATAPPLNVAQRALVDPIARSARLTLSPTGVKMGRLPCPC